MNLDKLFQMQQVLKDRIMEEHPELKEQDNLPWKSLALIVELGECANEWRGFKKWSHDQKPRTKAVRVPAMMEEDKEYYNPLLEEYVDGEHFFIDLALDLGIRPDEFYAYDEPLVGDTEEIFTEIIFHICLVKGEKRLEDKKAHLRMAHAIYLNLAVQRLGFTWEQIEQAYMQKNAVNHTRQALGY